MSFAIKVGPAASVGTSSSSDRPVLFADYIGPGFAVIFKAKKGEERWATLSNVNPQHPIDQIADKTVKYFKDRGITNDIKISIAGGWRSDPNSLQKGSALLKNLKKIDKNTDTTRMWKKVPNTYTSSAPSYQQLEKSFYPRITFDVRTGELREISAKAAESTETDEKDCASGFKTGTPPQEEPSEPFVRTFTYQTQEELDAAGKALFDKTFKKKERIS